jgi:hypothetical protein
MTRDSLTAARPASPAETERVPLGHGLGDRLMEEPLAGVIRPELGPAGPAGPTEDAAVVDLVSAGGHGEVIVSTDAFVAHGNAGPPDRQGGRGRAGQGPDVPHWRDQGRRHARRRRPFVHRVNVFARLTTSKTGIRAARERSAEGGRPALPGVRRILPASGPPWPIPTSGGYAE